MSLDPRVLKAAAQRYGLQPAQLSSVEGGHFTHVFEYRLGGQDFILRLTPPNPDVDLVSMGSMLEWLAFLGEQGGPVARPVRSQAGKLIETVGSLDGVYIAGAFEKAPGVLAENMTLADWDDALFQLLGKTLGGCHRIARDYQPARLEFRRPEWDQGGNCFNPRWAFTDADPTLLEKRAGVLSKMRDMPKDVDHYGLAHLDLHFGNFFVDKEQQRMVLFDFDDCAYGWYVMDIAMLLFDVLVVYEGSRPVKFGERFLVNLLRGYKTQMAVSTWWVDHLPDFLKLLEIGVYLMLYQDYDEESADDWVRKFMKGRRERIDRDAPYVELDFNAAALQALN